MFDLCNEQEGRGRLEEVLDSGAARDRFRRMLLGQGVQVSNSDAGCGFTHILLGRCGLPVVWVQGLWRGAAKDPACHPAGEEYSMHSMKP